MTAPAPATVTVVTAPAGHDPGPFTAWKAAHDQIGDGLAVRTVVSSDGYDRSGANLHASPIPADVPMTVRKATDLAMPLWTLPSAWHDPQTNLGVAFSGAVTGDLKLDIGTLDQIGWNPAHRVTVQYGTGITDMARMRRADDLSAVTIPAPVDGGDLAVQARDSVLRGSPHGSRYVLVEAGGGQTFLHALATLGLAPWEPSIEQLRLWLVIDCALFMHAEGRPGTSAVELRRVADLIAAEVVRQGGGWQAAPGSRGAHAAMRIALANVQLLTPGVAGKGQRDFDDDPPVGLADETLRDLNHKILTIEQRCGVNVGAVHTGGPYTVVSPIGAWVSLGIDALDPRDIR